MKKILGAVFVIALMVGLLIGAQQIDAVATETNKAVRKYQSAEEIVAAHYAYQLTEEQLNAPTEELIDLVLKYPFLCDLNSSSMPGNEPYDMLREMFNGFLELESRTDAASKMLEKYIENLKSAEPVVDCLYLDALLCVPVYKNQLTETERAVFAQAQMSIRVPINTNTCGIFDDDCS